MSAPITVREIELSDQINGLQLAPGHSRCRMLIRLNSVPVGWLMLNAKGASAISPDDLRHAIIEQFGMHVFKDVITNTFKKHLETHPYSPPISIIVCTRNRAKDLHYCIQALLALDYAEYEIIIVDNAPSDDDTYNLASKLPVRYVREERPGLDYARNRGIAEAAHDIVAFTDDDARADRFWLQAIAKNFFDNEVMAVSGLVAPFELNTESQQIFELKYGGMGHGFRKKIITRQHLSERRLLWASSFGIGANMAFRKCVFDKTGSFDPSLDVGTPSCGGGDIDMFFRLVAKGFTMIYDPEMIVWHTHRREFAALQKQITDNGRGFGCYLIKCFIERSVRRRSIIAFLLYDWFYRWNLKNIIRSKQQIPRTLSFAELTGMLMSPAAFAGARKITKKISETLPNPQYRASFN